MTDVIDLLPRDRAAFADLRAEVSDDPAIALGVAEAALMVAVPLLAAAARGFIEDCCRKRADGTPVLADLGRGAAEIAEDSLTAVRLGVKVIGPGTLPFDTPPWLLDLISGKRQL